MGLLVTDKTDLAKTIIRKNIIEYEKTLGQQEDAFFGDTEICPLKHSFSDGIYVREIFIPKGTYIVGKIHKHEHPNFLMSGTVDVITENNGKERLSGPLSMISSPGTKRALYAITDLVWITVHVNKNNTTDLEELEEEVIAKDYKEYEAFVASKNNTKNKIKAFLIKLLQ